MSRSARSDRTLKDAVLDEFRGILHRTQVPAIYVTHDQEEAFNLADRILLLHKGHIVQAGAPAEVMARAGFGLGGGISGGGEYPPRRGRFGIPVG